MLPEPNGKCGRLESGRPFSPEPSLYKDSVEYVWPIRLDPVNAQVPDAWNAAVIDWLSPHIL